MILGYVKAVSLFEV